MLLLVLCQVSGDLIPDMKVGPGNASMVDVNNIAVQRIGEREEGGKAYHQL